MSWLSGSEQERPWFRIGSYGVGTTEFVAGVSVIAMVLWAIDRTIVEWMTFDLAHVLRGAVWGFVTWPLANMPAFLTVWDIAIFWLMGRRVEQELGKARFGWMLLSITGAGSLLAVLLSLVFPPGLVLSSISTLAMIMVLLFIADNPRAPFFFGIPAWVIGLVLVAIPILQYLGMRAWLLFLHFVLTLMAAAIIAKFAGLLSQYRFIPGKAITDRPRVRTRKKSRGSSQGSTVVRGPWTTYEPPAREDAEMDALLDKIMASGLDSLTPKERKRLEELRQQRRSR